MKLECMGKMFAKSVVQISKARSKSSLHPTLQDVYLVLEDNALSFRATDLEVTAEKIITVKGIQNGRCLLKGDTLLKVVNFLDGGTDGRVSCELVDGVFVVTSGRTIMEINVTVADSFPILPEKGEYLGVLNKETFVHLVKGVLFCAATTEIKPEIASVYVYTKEGTIRSVATDSFRLAEQILPLSDDLDLSILIPQKHVADIVAILNDEDGDLSLFKNDGVLTITANSLTVSINLIGGSFPDYRQLFPKEYSTEVVCSKIDLQKALTLTTVFSEQFSQVKCAFGLDSLTVHSRNVHVGQVTNMIEIEKKGEDIEASYNNRYFIDVLPRLAGENVRMSFTMPMRPLVVRSITDDSFTYLLMPLNR